MQLDRLLLALPLAFVLAAIGACLVGVVTDLYRDVKVWIARWRIKRLR